MVWFDKRDLSPGILLRICYEIMKAGVLPKHVAFIMDGNRRFAKKQHIKTKDGHSKGFDKLTEVLNWCYELNIPEVTVYAFSIENFKRSEEEVDALITIFKDKLEKILEEKDLVMKYGVCFRFIGDISLFNDDLRETIAKVVNLTKSNKKSILNVAVGYTSRDEITQAIKEVSIGVSEGHIKESDICEEVLEQCFYTSECRPVDLLIRTSGEVRLSDFLLWQTSFSVLSFIDVLWPEMTVWDFFKCIIKYQLGYDSLQNSKELTKLKEERALLENDLKQASLELKQLNREHEEPNIKDYAEKRKQRCDTFIQNLRTRRHDELMSCLQCKS